MYYNEALGEENQCTIDGIALFTDFMLHGIFIWAVFEYQSPGLVYESD